MSRRSKAAYFAQRERVYSLCQECKVIGARYSVKDQHTLCKECRANLKYGIITVKETCPATGKQYQEQITDPQAWT